MSPWSPRQAHGIAAFVTPEEYREIIERGERNGLLGPYA